MAVDINFNVLLTWNEDNFTGLPTRVLVTNSNGTSHQLTANITFSPVNTTDSGDYTCRADLTAENSLSQTVMDTQSIDVAGEL